MPILRQRAIADRLFEIRRNYEHDLAKLKELAGEAETVLDIGCGGGYETIAMMWFLGANEAYGVDKVSSKLDGFASDFKRELDDSILALSYTQVSDEARRLWESTVPPFLREGKFPVFVELDIAAKDELNDALGDKSFNLAYCSSVLCHVHRNQSREAVRSSFEGLYGVLPPGAWFLADEPYDSELRYFETELTRVGFDVSMHVLEGRANYQCRRSA